MRMRGLASALVLLASLPLAAWEAPTQNELQALCGEEPQLTILQCGQPLPPTREEAQATGLRFFLERAALKRALVYRTSCAKADRGRITAENNRTTATLARYLGAPRLFVEYLELLASGELSRRQEYAVEQAMRLLLQESYMIDTLQIRLLSESVNMPPREHTLCLLQLPIGFLFDLVPNTPPERRQLFPDVMTMAGVFREQAQVLAEVQSPESAEAAVAKLQNLLPLWYTTQQIRYHAASLGGKFQTHEQWAIDSLLNPASQRVTEQRRRLQQHNWFGSTRLRMMNELLR